MELKGRLGAIAQKIPQCNTLADIGTDHAYIPVFAVKSSKCIKAIASDVKKGPVEIAARNIKHFGYENLIETRIGFGLDTLRVSEAEVIVIAGMGGLLIQDIIERNTGIAKSAELLVLQPMNSEELLRKWLNENGFEILEEELSAESDKIYDIICAKWTGKTLQMDDFLYYIGYGLVNRSDAIFRKYAFKKLSLIKKKICGMQKARKLPFGEIDNLIDIKNRLEELLKVISQTAKCGGKNAGLL